MLEFGLFHIYLAFLVFGVGYAVIVFFLGAIGGDHGGSGDSDVSTDHGSVSTYDGTHESSGVESHHDVNGLSPFSPLMLATFGTLFGGLGFITMGIFGLIKIVPSSISNIVSLLLSASLAIILSSYFSFFLVKLFVKTETASNISSAKLIGREAEVTLPLEPGSIGEVAYFHGGSRMTSMAKLVEGAPSVKKGQTVEIVSISENIMWVKPVENKETDVV